MIVYFLYIVIFLCCVHVVFNYNGKARALKRIPGFRDRFIVGNALELLLSPVDLMQLPRKSAKNLAKIFRFWSFPIGAVVIYDPEDIEKVLQSMKHNEKALIYRILQPWLKDGLLLSNGLKWQQRRKILTPSFHFNILKQFLVTLEENSARLVKDLEGKVEQEIDIVPLISEFTLNSICETSMGTKLSDETSSAALSYKNAIYELGKKFVDRFTKVHYNIDFIFALSSIGRQQKRYLEIVHDFTKRVIKDRKEYIETFGIDIDEMNVSDEDIFFKSKRKTAMLDLLISAQNKGLIDDNGVQEEVDTFMFEGHDTTAAALAFCLMSIANDKGIQERLFSELDGIFGDSSQPATMDDLSRMQYLECCIKESLRLYPPVHLMGRTLGETVTLSDYVVEKGTYILILIYDMHRREDLFKDALKYNPDRFLPENSIGRHPFSFIPFSAGPRNCIGQKFAMLEMKSSLSAILRRYRLEPVTGHGDIEITADVVLRTSHPILVKFVRREK
uniref:CYP4M39 n=1 Tax=Chilo suppressalis TaxID=168631 RepID=X5DT35_CHISP|nr:CYP4M39 [Chilo suppressalis]